MAPLSFAVSIVTWLVALALLIGHNLGRPWSGVRTRRRRPADVGGDGNPAPVADAEEVQPQGDPVP